MSLESRILAAVERRQRANAEYYRLEFDEECPQRLGPPASPDDLVRLEELFGGPLPPSYRAFMALYDGWYELSGGIMILPVRERAAPWVARKEGAIRESYREFYDGRTLDGAFFALLGEDETNFAYLDRSKRAGGGEVEIVYADLVDGEYDRFPDFAALLEDLAATMERLVDKSR